MSEKYSSLKRDIALLSLDIELLRHELLEAKEEKRDYIIGAVIIPKNFYSYSVAW